MRMYTPRSTRDRRITCSLPTPGLSFDEILDVTAEVSFLTFVKRYALCDWSSDFGKYSIVSSHAVLTPIAVYECSTTIEDV